jgi:hypothetical protein
MPKRSVTRTQWVLSITILLGCDYASLARALQNSAPEFCASRTTEAYHSAKCDWGWVVHDPRRVTDVKISHVPKYHTYSRWVLGDQTYILAYRDMDNSPDDMAADIYRADDGGRKLIGSVQHLGEIITDVFDAKLTGTAIPDVVFRLACGTLQCIIVVRFSNEKPQEVFRHGASKIEIFPRPKPMIVANTKHAVVEQFVWDVKGEKFSRKTMLP